MAEREYIKLTPLRQRGGFGIISTSRSNLWLAKDHLLCVETEGYTESYKRFFFQDLQAITLRRTSRGRLLGAVTGGIAACFGVLALTASAIESRWILGSLAAVCALPFVANLLYGPTCSCQLRTAVQTEDIPSLGRVRRARKVMDRIRPLIAEAQGLLNLEEIPLRFQEVIGSSAPEPSREVGPGPGNGSTDMPPRVTR